MRYTVTSKPAPIKTIQGFRYRIQITPHDDLLYPHIMWIEEDDYKRVRMGQEITVDVVAVPKEEKR